MSEFETATEFFHTCESAKGWNACSKFVEMSDDNKVKSMQKVWNAPWAMRELGWA